MKKGRYSKSQEKSIDIKNGKQEEKEQWKQKKISKTIIPNYMMLKKNRFE